MKNGSLGLSLVSDTQLGQLSTTQPISRGGKKTNIHRRMKKMTNPMAAPFRVPVPAPDWSEVLKPKPCTLNSQP